VFAFLFALGVWSAVAPLESAAIANGFIAVESSRKTIQHLEGGIISKIHVRDGQSIVAGQLLVQLEDTKARTQLQAIKVKLWEAWARQARLTAERDEQADIEIPAELISSARDSSVAQILDGHEKFLRLVARCSLLRLPSLVSGWHKSNTKLQVLGPRKQQQPTVHESFATSTQQSNRLLIRAFKPGRGSSLWREKWPK